MEVCRGEPPCPPRFPPLAGPRRDADHLLVTAAQMAELESRLFASGLPVEALMEKAALAVSRRLISSARTSSLAARTPMCWCWWDRATMGAMDWWWPVNSTWPAGP